MMTNKLSFTYNPGNNSSYSIDGQSLNLSSMSSGSSSDSVSTKSVSDIKSKIEFNHLPLFLKRFKILIFAIFLTLISTTVALLIVNYNSNQTFVDNVNAVRNMKRLRGVYAMTKMMVLMLHGSVNVPSVNAENSI